MQGILRILDPAQVLLILIGVVTVVLVTGSIGNNSITSNTSISKNNRHNSITLNPITPKQ